MVQTAKSQVQTLQGRLLDFSAFIIKGLEALRHHPEGKYMVGQLFRSSTSVGANYAEAQAAESRADFVHKLQIALKESRETAYWLQLSEKIEWFEDAWRTRALQEIDEIMRILGKSIVNAKKSLPLFTLFLLPFTLC